MNLRYVDLWLVIPTVGLLTLGGIILSSVSPAAFPNHFLFIFLAVLTFLLFSNLDLRILRAASPFLYAFGLTLLLATLIFGGFIRGASRWIEIGPFAFQPSEITKPLFILFFANLLSLKRGPLLALIAFLPAFLLIFLQPDLGSAIVLSSGLFGVLFLGGVPIVWFGLSIVLFTVFTPLFWRLLKDFQKIRILSFLSPFKDPLGAGYNSIQAMIAIGAGGLFGRGLGQGTQSQLAFLPERHTDFVFAALSEELGFLASLATIFLFVVILFRILIVIKNTQSRFPQTLLGGIFFVLLTHVVVNIGMNLGVLPVTGIPLPFVSSGGSSLISMSAMLGIVSRASRSLRSASNIDIMATL